MTPRPGDRVGPYEILAALGEGGMGQVWRARDLRLPREVAIKLLPDALSGDPERLARFTRESEILATMSHPHIATLYGVEEGAFGRAIVMELVPGDGLDARIAGGGLPVGEALAIARDVADALESAHERGIVHRDLKPANLKLASDSRVKVLDFGLARAAEAAVAGGRDTSAMTMGMTQAGTIVGTASYMSPEQARGETVDRRTDIWAFGCVLYEMLTGRRAFDGRSAVDAIGAILRSEPDLDLLPDATPVPVRHLIERCLRKDARQRLRDVGDARLVIEDVLSGASAAAAQTRGRPPAWRLHAAWAVAALALAVATGLVAYRLQGRSAPPALSKLEVLVADPIVSTATRPQLSPDGRSVVYAAADRLWVRRLDQADAREVPGSALAERPFWSPDGSELAFAARGQLWRVGVDAGAPVPLCDLPGTGRIIAGAWRPDGAIVFSSWFGPLYRVPAGGGDPVLFHEDPAVVDFHEITFLPDGQTLLLVPHRAAGNLAEIAALRDGRRQTVLQAPPHSQVDMPCYARRGHLVFVRRQAGEGIWAVPFDPKAVAVRGEPFRVVAGEWAADVSENGDTLAYTHPGVPHQLAWLDRTGKRLGAFGEPRWLIASPAISRDGRRVAAAASEVAFTAHNLRQMWTFDAASGRAQPLPVPPEPTNEDNPEWSPDGTRLLSVESRQHPWHLIWRTVGDGTLPTRLTPGTGRPSYAPDGRTVAYARAGPAGDSDIWTIDLSSSGQAGTPAVLIDGPGSQQSPRFSPDGRFLAYESDQSGRREIYVQRFPLTPERWVVSRDGGGAPRWSRNGQELVYRARDGRVMAVAVTLGAAFKAAEPQALFSETAVPGSMSREFDVAPDGQRFLVVARAPGHTSRIVVVQNWLREFEP